MPWSEEALRGLLQKDGFRLRGLEMTRLEVFTDAAFAFAISIHFGRRIEALQHGLPATRSAG